MIVALYKKKHQPDDLKRFYVDQVSPLGISLYQYNVPRESATKWKISTLDDFNDGFEFVDWAQTL